MAVFANGKTTVAAAGTPVQLSTPTGVTRAKWLTIQALSTNTGNIYVGVKGLNKATLAGVLAILTPTAPPLPIFTEGPSLNGEDIFIDGDTNGNAVVSGGAS
jgi:hypothetical protein